MLRHDVTLRAVRKIKERFFFSMYIFSNLACVWLLIDLALHRGYCQPLQELPGSVDLPIIQHPLPYYLSELSIHYVLLHSASQRLAG